MTIRTAAIDLSAGWGDLLLTVLEWRLLRWSENEHRTAEQILEVVVGRQRVRLRLCSAFVADHLVASAIF